MVEHSAATQPGISFGSWWRPKSELKVGREAGVYQANRITTLKCVHMCVRGCLLSVFPLSLANLPHIFYAPGAKVMLSFGVRTVTCLENKVRESVEPKFSICLCVCKNVNANQDPFDICLQVLPFPWGWTFRWRAWTAYRRWTW